jgi:hypothetical protein
MPAQAACVIMQNCFSVSVVHKLDYQAFASKWQDYLGFTWGFFS